MQYIPMGWRSSAKNAIFDASCAALFLDPENDHATAFFRESWQDNGNAAPPPDQDVCYYRLFTRDDPYANMASRESTTAGIRTSEILPFTCQWVFYGPNADRYSSFMRTAIYRAVYTKKGDIEYPPPVTILKNGNITMEPFPAQPVRLPEPSADGWRNRSDLIIQMNMLVVNEFQSDGVEVTPDIHVIHEEE